MLEIEISRRLMSRGAHLLKSSTHSMLYRNSSKFGWFSYHLILHQLSLCPSALKMSSFAYFCNPLIEKTWKTKNVVKWWKDFWWYLITLGIHCDLLCPFTTKYVHWFSYKVWSKRIVVSTVVNYSHLAWADFRIKVKRIEHSIVHFDQWNKLISKM